MNGPPLVRKYKRRKTRQLDLSPKKSVESLRRSTKRRAADRAKAKRARKTRAKNRRAA